MGPSLETERLILRPPVEADLDGWAALMGDEEAARFLGGPISRPASWRAMATVAGSWQLKGFGMFSVIEKRSEQWLGSVGPWQPEGWPGTEVGWSLIKAAWGKGYALEAARAAIDWAFHSLNWGEVIHTIGPENMASRRLAERLGATNSGPGKLPPPFEDSQVDVWRQSRADWERRQSAEECGRTL